MYFREGSIGVHYNQVLIKKKINQATVLCSRRGVQKPAQLLTVTEKSVEIRCVFFGEQNDPNSEVDRRKPIPPGGFLFGWCDLTVLIEECIYRILQAPHHPKRYPPGGRGILRSTCMRGSFEDSIIFRTCSFNQSS